MPPENRNDSSAGSPITIRAPSLPRRMSLMPWRMVVPGETRRRASISLGSCRGSDTISLTRMPPRSHAAAWPRCARSRRPRTPYQPEPAPRWTQQRLRTGRSPLPTARTAPVSAARRSRPARPPSHPRCANDRIATAKSAAGSSMRTRRPFSKMFEPVPQQRPSAATIMDSQSVVRWWRGGMARSLGDQRLQLTGSTGSSSRTATSRAGRAVGRTRRTDGHRHQAAFISKMPISLVGRSFLTARSTRRNR